MELVASALAFFGGVLRRFYCWAPSIFLDPFDFYERYVRPHVNRDIDMPSEWFPVALGGGMIVAALLTYHDLKTKAGGSTVTFEIREASIRFNNYNHDRPEQPLDLAQIDVTGALRNRGSQRAVIDGISVSLEQKILPLLWKPVGTPRHPTLRNEIGANIDLYYHGISVDAHSRSRGVSEIWGYVSMPTTIVDQLTRHHRVRVTVLAADHLPASTLADVDVNEAYHRDLHAFEQRILRRQG